MKQGNKTEWEQEQEQALANSNLEWTISVINRTDMDEGMTGELLTGFSSKDNDLDSVVHKLKLDLITAIKFGYEMPFEVKVRRIIPSCK